MPIVSHMWIAIQQGQRAAAIKAFRERGVLEECAQSIPGFITAQLLVSQTARDEMCVMAEWQQLSDFEAWTRHPVRDAQEADLAHFLAKPPVVTLFERDVQYTQS